MLRYLELKHFALLDQIVFRPGPCLNILTGETGAGKSLLLDALGAVTGNRTSKDVIRNGHEQALVEAVFDFEPGLLPEDLSLSLFSPEELDTADAVLILSREINRNGRGLCRINGRIVPLARLKDVSSYLLDIHGQHESQKIFQVSTHLGILDQYGGDSCSELLNEYKTAYNRLRSIRSQMEVYGGSEQERARQYDLLTYQYNEITLSKPRPNEDELLQKKRVQLSGAARLKFALTQVVSMLDQEEGAASSLASAISTIRTVESNHDSVPEYLSRLEGLLDEATDIRLGFTGLADQIEDQPELLEKIDARLDRLFRLKKKYGETLEDVLRYAEGIRREMDRLEAAEAEMARLHEEETASLADLANTGAALSQGRKAIAAELAQMIGSELADLGMKHARFDTQFMALPIELARSSGLDQVEFLFSANPGETLKPLARIASGGEASRIMLAIKLVLSHATALQLLIFDEVDSGVSGETAALVGQKLMQLGQSSQVMCVTHTAQVAAMADSHFGLEKQISSNQTITTIRELDAEQHLQVVARLLAGTTDPDTALRLAKALTDQAKVTRESALSKNA